MEPISFHLFSNYITYDEHKATIEEVYCRFKILFIFGLFQYHLVVRGTL